MTREQAEKKIAKKIQEIEKIARKYSPNWSGYITMSIMEDGVIMFWNEVWEKDKDCPLDWRSDKC